MYKYNILKYLNVHFINMIEFLCLTILITLFPFSIEYILFGCNEISEELNTLFRGFKVFL